LGKPCCTLFSSNPHWLANMTNESKGPAPGRVAERRTHPRYGFNADAKVSEEISGTPIEARIADISERGCYVETASSFSLGTEVQVHISKRGESFDAAARVVYSSEKGMGLAFGQLGENQLEILEIWLGPLRERDWLVQNRRRTQRVIMRVPVRISGQNAVGSQFEEETNTLAVNANGALVVLSVSVRKGQVLHIVKAQLERESLQGVSCIVPAIRRTQRSNGDAEVWQGTNFIRG
jgi:PilZ domain